jgi:hypothetical protein
MARSSGAERSDGPWRFAWLAALLAASGVAGAQSDEGEGRRGQVSISYQYNEAHSLVADNFIIPSAKLTTNAVDFAFDFAVNSRWTVSGGVPLVSRKDNDPTHLHNPLAVAPPQLDSPYLDDGKVHTYWQDLRFGASYLVPTDPLTGISVEPYVQISIPTNHYPFFGNAAVGQHLRHTEIGATLGYHPPFLPWYFDLRAGYSYAPSTLDVGINATRVDGEAVRFLNPRLSYKIFFSSKHGDGIPVLAVLPDLSSALWFYHDRITRHNYANIGVGTDWRLTNGNVLEFDWIKMVRAQDVFRPSKALNFTLSHPFGRAAPQTQASPRIDQPSTFSD